MIQIVRGPEPQALIDAREEHLSRAALEAGAEGPATIEGYDVARTELHARQFSKCAYCESLQQQESQPTEHFRPKGRPSRIDWSGLREPRSDTPAALAANDESRFARGLPPLMFDRVRWPDPSRQPIREPGYWWLAWTWENLSFGCQSCNGPSRKGTRFPLARASATLDLHEQPPGAEQALLLDPTDPQTDPMDFIQFRWDSRHWRPFPIRGDARAAWTIAVLGLDSVSLLSHYTTRVKTLDQMARAFRDRIAANASDATIRSEWTVLHESVLDPGQPYLALAHDWLAATFASEVQRYALPLSRPYLRHPTASGDAMRQPPLPRRVDLDGLSERLQHRIRFMRHVQARSEELRALLVDICRECPSTTEELADLLDRRAVLPGHLRELERCASLARDASTGHWIPGSGAA